MTVKSIGSAGLSLIKHFEGIKLTAYLCPANVWTIGYGSTGNHVKRGMTITARQAEDLLKRDLVRFETAVAKAVPTVTQPQFDAMVSLTFNIGVSAFHRSTLLRKHVAGDYVGAKAEFARWNKAGGIVLNGLTRRRAAEAALYRP